MPTELTDGRTCRVVAAASGLFCAVLIAGMAREGLRYDAPGWFDREMIPMVEKVRRQPKAPAVLERARAVDLGARLVYFESRRKLRTGAWLLLGGLALFALSMRRLAVLGVRPPRALRPEDMAESEREAPRAAIVALSVSVPLAAVALVLMHSQFRKPAAAPAPGVEAPPVAVAQSPELPLEKDVPEALRWPALRGPTRMGIVAEGGFPTEWDAAAGKGIVWKTKVPLPGNSSPIVWGERIFLTGASAGERKVFCFARRTGELAWSCTIRTRPGVSEGVETTEDTGLASPTPVADGERVYAFFGTNELAAVDFTGRQVWARWLGKPDSAYGVATSPLLHGNTLFLQLDQGQEGAGKSFLYAFNPSDGKESWKVARDVGNSWSSPVIARTPQGAELVTAAAPWVISYEPSTGAVLWQASVLSGDVAPPPVYADGMVYVVTEYSKLSAIRTGGSGDVTETNVAWTYDRDLPDVAGPLTDGRLLLMTSGGGAITCLDAKSGEVRWFQQMETGFWSSPTLAGRRVYATDKTGRTFIFELKDRYDPQGGGTVGEPVVATPAFVDGKIYIRGREHLFCIGK